MELEVREERFVLKQYVDQEVVGHQGNSEGIASGHMRRFSQKAQPTLVSNLYLSPRFTLFIRPNNKGVSVIDKPHEIALYYPSKERAPAFDFSHAVPSLQNIPVGSSSSG